MSRVPHRPDASRLETWDNWTELPQYEYKLLPTGCIRLLILFPGQSESDDIFCEIVDRPVDPHQPTAYEALSWAWGSDAWTASIQIRDQGRYYRQNIPQSLSSALRVLRYRTAERIIWADAVCINQKSTDEKNVQVPLMSTIYGAAFNVCIWLGNSDEHTASAIDFMKNEILKLHNFDQLCESADAIPSWNAMLHLMQRPWFSRRWVVQEIALSRDAVMYCGKYQIRWHDFASAVQLVVEAESTNRAISNSMKHVTKFLSLENQFEHVNALGASLLVDATRNMFRNTADNRLQPVFTIEYLVARMQAFDVSEPKDAIYALLALARDTEPIHATSPKSFLKFTSPAAQMVADWADQHSSRKSYLVDYSLSYVDVCIQFILFCIRHSEPTQALNILCRPWAPILREGKMASGGSAPVPSWIHSLSTAAFSMFHYPYALSRMSRSNADSLVGLPGDKIRYSAAGTTSAYSSSVEFVTRLKSSSMIVSGFIVDEVSEVQAASQNGHISEGWINMANWTDLAQEPPAEFWRTLIADRGIDGGNAPRYGARAVHLSVIRTPSGGYFNTAELINSPSLIISQFFRRVQAVIWNKSLMRSRTGRLGLVRSNVHPGDRICILHGCSVPVILRSHRKTPMMQDEEHREDEERAKRYAFERLLRAAVFIQRFWRARKGLGNKFTSEERILTYRSFTEKPAGSQGYSQLPSDGTLSLILAGLTHDEPRLRATPESSTNAYFYTFLGECYLHRMMDGEAIRYQNVHNLRFERFELR